MSDSTTYSVVLSGNIESGFEPDLVVDAFAKLFKLSPEKAKNLVGTKFVMKKEVELQVAKNYKDKLSAIGIEVLLKRHGGIDELSLKPVQNPEPEAVAVGDATQQPEPSKPKLPNGMVCPKCNLEQPKSEQCSGCGVFVNKVAKRAAESKTASQSAQPLSTDEVQEDAVIDEPRSALKLFIAPVIAAVLGALLWYLIAIGLDYEFGLIAWLIGGAVGYAAIMSGASGDATGVVCAILVLCSIFGGKYLIVASQQSELAEALSTSIEYEGIDLREFYEEEKNDAREFMKLPGDDASLRKFMVAHEYSDFTDASQVPDDELDVFREYTQPRLEDINLNRPSFDEWRQNSLTSSIEDLPTFDLMLENLGWMDILFLFFGIGTAYRLASRGM